MNLQFLNSCNNLKILVLLEIEVFQLVEFQRMDHYQQEEEIILWKKDPII